MPLTLPNIASESETPYLGLAPFLRMSIAGTDLQAIGQQMLTKAAHLRNGAV